MITNSNVPKYDYDACGASLTCATCVILRFVRLGEVVCCVAFYNEFFAKKSVKLRLDAPFFKRQHVKTTP